MPDLSQKFAEDGVVHVPGLVPAATITALIKETAALAATPEFQASHNMRCRFAMYPDSGAQVLDALDPITDLAESAASIANADGVHTTLATLLGEPACLFKDKYILRQPGAPGYPPHQDFIAWPFFPKTFTTVLIAIDEFSTRSGCLEFYLGSHKRGLLAKADGDFHTIATALLHDHPKVAFELAPGDALFFNGFVVHQSSRNESNALRRSLYLSYNAASDGGEQRQSHYRYFHSWLKRRFGEYGDSQLYFK